MLISSSLGAQLHESRQSRNNCLGKCCKERENPVEKRKAAKTLTTQGILIPGLEGSNRASSSVLYCPSFTSTAKSKIFALSPNSSIFKPNPQKATFFKISLSLSSSTKVSKTSAPKPKNKKSNPRGYEESVKLQRKLNCILLQASLKTGKTEKQAKKKNPVDPQKRNSFSRKLSISEISCSKLSSKHTYSSLLILLPSPLLKPICLLINPPLIQVQAHLHLTPALFNLTIARFLFT